LRSLIFTPYQPYCEIKKIKAFYATEKKKKERHKEVFLEVESV
jgi:hypothetical protein